MYNPVIGSSVESDPEEREPHDKVFLSLLVPL